jgi:predicted kinase
MELVVFVGPEAAGKSSFYRARFAETHALVSKDVLRDAGGRQTHQMALIERALQRGESVVVDNTNPRIEDRAPLIALGRVFGARLVAYDFEATTAECQRRNALREGRARVPEVAIYLTARKLEPPLPAEGFDAIFRVRLTEAGFEVTAEAESPRHADRLEDQV